MTYTSNDITKQALERFKSFDTDTKLALLWYGYLAIKDKLDPAPPSDVTTLGKTLFDQVQTLPKEEQLQAQRDMIEGADSEVGRAYSAFDSSAKMDAWLLLARGMEDGTIIQVPSDYQLPEQTKEFTDLITDVEFEERINFMRSAVMEM
jgi:hypothetical protein